MNKPIRRQPDDRPGRVHKGVFLPGRPATGVLHVEEQHGGDEPSFKLSRPRYSAARRTVSFKARRLNGKRLSPGAAGAAEIARTPSRPGTRSQTRSSLTFGRSSLTVNSRPTVVPAPADGNRCEAFLENRAGAVPDVVFSATAFSAWDTDSWIEYPPQDNHAPPPPGVDQFGGVAPGYDGQWSSQGGNLRGCHNEATFGLTQNGDKSPGSFTIQVSRPWGQLPSSTCEVSDPVYKFKCTRDDRNGNIIWLIESA